MSNTDNNALEMGLAALTAPVDRASHLWMQALRTVAPTASHRQGRLRLHRPEWLRSVNPLPAAMLVIVVGAVLMAVLSPSLGSRSRSNEMWVAGGRASRGARIGTGAVPGDRDRIAVQGRMQSSVDETWEYEGILDGAGDTFSEGMPRSRPTAGMATNDVFGLQDDPEAPVERAVVQKATIELLTDDVRSVFLKAGMLVNEASGEYVQESSMTGDGEKAQANLILRVSADRLSDVLNELRTLGIVGSEKVSGDDVTAQMVDLDARLRNEQRIEQELLELLDTRQDSPLKEIIELREQIGYVRRGIEQMKAQQQHLNRLVSLATVLVIIRHDQQMQQQTDGLWVYFKTSVADAWSYGLEFLADSVAWLVAVIVGGLLWWLIAAAACVIAWRVHRNKKGRAGSEPAGQST